MINQNLSVSCRVNSKVQSSQFFATVNKALTMFLFTFVQYTVKSVVTLFFSFCCLVLNINKQFLTFATFILGLILKI